VVCMAIGPLYTMATALRQRRRRRVAFRMET